MTQQTITSPEVRSCPLCGATAVAPIPSKYSVLLAVSDVLVLKALEGLGRRIVREERGRFQHLDGRPFHDAHTVWRPTMPMMNRTLDSAWEVMPAILSNHDSCGITLEQITTLLSRYLIDLVNEERGHALDELTKRFIDSFGITIDLGDQKHEHALA